MSVGDKWEISFAAPITNGRFTEWGRTPADGAIGWYTPSTSGFAVTVRPWPYVGGPGPNCHALFTASTTPRYFQTVLPDRSLSPIDCYSKILLRYKSDQNFYCDVDWRSFGGSSQGNTLIARNTAAAWTLYEHTQGAHSELSGARIRFYSTVAAWNLWLGEIVLRWTPYDWGDNAYTQIDGKPNADGFYYGPLAQTGEVSRYADGTGQWFGLGNRAEKWTLRATFEDLEEADYLTLQRYYLGSLGMLDGVPRPVAIRPYVVDTADAAVWSPEILVGFFASFAFAPRSLSGTYSGELALEEM